MSVKYEAPDEPCGVCGATAGAMCATTCSEYPFDMRDVRARVQRLASNLAVAGALCAAFYEGFGEGFSASSEGFNGEYASRLTGERFTKMAQDSAIGGAYGPTWKPGCGEPAPGFDDGKGE